MDAETKHALQQLRSDVLTALTRIEGRVIAVQYGLLEKNFPINPERLKKLQNSVESDASLLKEIHDYLDRTIRKTH